MKKGKDEVSIVRSSAAEYLTFIASTGDSDESMEPDAYAVRYPFLGQAESRGH